MTLGLISLDQLYSLRFSDEFIWNVFLAVLTGPHLAGVQALCQTLQGQENALSKGVRDAAFVSFSLYLLQNPVLQFLKPMMSSVGRLPLPDLSLLVMTLLHCALFGAAFERTLRPQRALVLQLFAARPKRT
ncbi:hypothetical protein [Yoonia sediminilitoris]|uniref:Uncharacterized protein n=1 Tax=Yoonia sediminilitoris TaxID=1286148 RepID=A0A2T6KDN0_9RHOB|nr:hypothetical protein [Yoonia sediminilitoris]PUB13118.1 hypothetical protein C8N45_10838 [Yoonia sediminilitoris]RCW94453.1 hypothetical protein DFP92_10839 [Yoonia sediminilitoris]